MGWGSQEVTAYTSDISMSGVFVETNRCLPVGTEVLLDFQLVNAGESLPVSVQGTVARRVFTQRKDDPKHLVGIGVEFREFVAGEDLLREVLTRLEGAASPGHEQRQCARIPTSLPITWGTGEACELSGSFSDISVDGAFILQADARHAPGTRLHLKFEVPNQGRFREVKAMATVVRNVAAKDAGGMAVVFELSSVDVDYLHSFITRRLPQGQAAGSSRTHGTTAQPRGGAPSLAARARPSMKKKRSKGSGVPQIRLRWIFKALCYTLPVLFLLGLLVLC